MAEYCKNCATKLGLQASQNIICEGCAMYYTNPNYNYFKLVILIIVLIISVQLIYPIVQFLVHTIAETVK